MALNFLPLGCKFAPTKQELIGYFLTKKLEGEALPLHYPQFLDRDVYSDHPFNLLKSTIEACKDDTLTDGYFFTPLTAISNGKNVTRVVRKHGTWLEKAATNDVFDKAGVKIGEYKYFKFQPADEECKKNDLNKNEWCMHEYSKQGCPKDIVLSHIFKKKEGRKDNIHHSGTKLLKGIPNYMIVDHPLDNGAGPSKRRRVIDDPTTDGDEMLLLAEKNNNNGVGEEGLIIGDDVPDSMKDFEDYLEQQIPVDDDDNNNNNNNNNGVGEERLIGDDVPDWMDDFANYLEGQIPVDENNNNNNNNNGVREEGLIGDDVPDLMDEFANYLEGQIPVDDTNSNNNGLGEEKRSNNNNLDSGTLLKDVSQTPSSFDFEYDMNVIKQSILEVDNGHNFGIAPEEMMRPLQASREMRILEELVSMGCITSIEDYRVVYSTSL